MTGLSADVRARVSYRLGAAGRADTPAMNGRVKTWARRYREDVGYLLAIVDARAGTEDTTLAGDGPPTLFDPPVIPVDATPRGTHRAPDHATSERAGLSDPGRRTSQRVRILRAFWDNARSWQPILGHGLTDEAAARDAGIDLRSSPWKRCSELRDGGWLEWTGDVRNTSTGSEAKVWRLTDAGRAAADAMWSDDADIHAVEEPAR